MSVKWRKKTLKQLWASNRSKLVHMAPNGSKWVQVDPIFSKSKKLVRTFWVCNSLPWSGSMLYYYEHYLSMCHFRRRRAHYECEEYRQWVSNVQTVYMEEFVSTTFPSDLLTAECTEYRHHDSGKFQDLPTKILLSNIIMTFEFLRAS